MGTNCFPNLAFFQSSDMNSFGVIIDDFGRSVFVHLDRHARQRLAVIGRHVVSELSVQFDVDVEQL